VIKRNIIFNSFGGQGREGEEEKQANGPRWQKIDNKEEVTDRQKENTRQKTKKWIAKKEIPITEFLVCLLCLSIHSV